VNYEQTKAGILVPKSSKRPEMREVATTRDGRDITRGYVDPFMLQRPTDSVLQLRGGGDYGIYKEVLRDDHPVLHNADWQLSRKKFKWTPVAPVSQTKKRLTLHVSK
jgi:hypothetical protein